MKDFQQQFFGLARKEKPKGSSQDKGNRTFVAYPIGYDLAQNVVFARSVNAADANVYKVRIHQEVVLKNAARPDAAKASSYRINDVRVKQSPVAQVTGTGVLKPKSQFLLKGFTLDDKGVSTSADGAKVLSGTVQAIETLNNNFSGTFEADVSFRSHTFEDGRILINPLVFRRGNEVITMRASANGDYERNQDVVAFAKRLDDSIAKAQEILGFSKIGGVNFEAQRSMPDGKPVFQKVPSLGFYLAVLARDLRTDEEKAAYKVDPSNPKDESGKYLLNREQRAGQKSMRVVFSTAPLMQMVETKEEDGQQKSVYRPISSTDLDALLKAFITLVSSPETKSILLREAMAVGHSQDKEANPDDLQIAIIPFLRYAAGNFLLGGDQNVKKGSDEKAKALTPNQSVIRRVLSTTLDLTHPDTEGGPLKLKGEMSSFSCIVNLAEPRQYEVVGTQAEVDDESATPKIVTVGSTFVHGLFATNGGRTQNVLSRQSTTTGAPLTVPSWMEVPYVPFKPKEEKGAEQKMVLGEPSIPPAPESAGVDLGGDDDIPF